MRSDRRLVRAIAVCRRPSSSSIRPRSRVPSTSSAPRGSDGAGTGPTLTFPAAARSKRFSVCEITGLPFSSLTSNRTADALAASPSHRQVSRGDSDIRWLKADVAPCISMRAFGRSRVTSNAMRTCVVVVRSICRTPSTFARVMPPRSRTGSQVLRETYGVLRFEKCVRLLVSEQARLQFDVGAVVVGERGAPIGGVAVVPPRPHFVGWKLRRESHVNGAALVVGMVDADESFLRTVGEQRDRSIILISNDAEVAPLVVDRPSFDSSEPVSRHQLGWIDEM